MLKPTFVTKAPIRNQIHDQDLIPPYSTILQNELEGFQTSNPLCQRRTPYEAADLIMKLLGFRCFVHRSTKRPVAVHATHSVSVAISRSDLNWSELGDICVPYYHYEDSDINP